MPSNSKFYFSFLCMRPQHMIFNLPLIPALQSNHSLYGMDRDFFLTLFKFYTVHEARSFLPFLAVPWLRMHQASTVVVSIFMSLTHLGLYSLPFAAVILITFFTMAFLLAIRPVNSFHQTIFHLSSDEFSHDRTKKPIKLSTFRHTLKTHQ